PDPEGWFQTQLADFGSPEPLSWRQWLGDAILEWRGQWTPRLGRFAASQNNIAQQCLTALEQKKFDLDRLKPALHAHGVPALAGAEREKAANALATIAAAAVACPRGKVGPWRNPLEDFLSEAAFLASLAAVRDSADPLTEDWNWVRS